MAESQPPATVGAADTPTIRLPAEIWKKVILDLRKDDLKRVRLVNSAFNDFAIPQLFNSICYSSLSESEARFQSLAKNNKINQYVQRVYLDTTTYLPLMEVHEYVNVISVVFADTLGVNRALFNEGPLSPSKLLKVLDTDTSLQLSNAYLSGKPRWHFINGWAQYCTRGQAQRAKVNSDGIYKFLRLHLPSLKNLRHIETITSWTCSDSVRRNFESFLYHSLPKQTFEQIPGLRNTGTLRDELEKKVFGSFVAPGVAARRLNFMCMEPQPSTCYARMMTHEIVFTTLRVLQEKHMKLATLSLPGHDFIGAKDTDARLREGMVSVPTLGAHLHGPDVEEKTLLLPLFKHLKQLDLSIDHSHPGTMNWLRYQLDLTRLPRALQSMRDIESLSLGYKLTHSSDGTEPPEPPTLYMTLLMREQDYENEEAEDDDNDDGAPGIGGPVIGGDFVNMLASMFGMPPPPTSNGPFDPGAQATTTAPPPPPVNPTTAQAHSASTQNTAGHVPHVHGAAIPGFAMGTFGPNGELIAFPPVASVSHNSHKTCCGVNPTATDPLKPNPWPKLKHLKLWNMPARKVDIVRLFQTVGGGLQTLSMHNIYIANKPSSEESDDGSGDEDEPLPPLENITNTTSAAAKKPVPKKSTHLPLSDFSGILLSKLPKLDAWFETIEILGDIPLRLERCEIDLGEHDFERMFETLCSRVEGFDDGGVDLDEALGTYLIEGCEGRGMGFALHVAQMVREQRLKWGNDEDDDDDEDDGMIWNRPQEAASPNSAVGMDVDKGKNKRATAFDELAEGDGGSEWEDSDGEDLSGDDLDEAGLQSADRSGWGRYGAPSALNLTQLSYRTREGLY